jgi:hypothetical protein
MRRAAFVTVELALLLAMVATANAVTTVNASVAVAVTTDVRQPLGVNQMALGMTYTNVDLRPDADPAAAASAAALIQASMTYQNVSIMGWGSDNPEPSPGRFDWSSLDARIQQIQATGGTPVITLCCAPDWMKGGRPGQTDWSQLNKAPTPNHFADFADLARAVAQRYPSVMYYQVWNELKSFWNVREQRWDYEGYTAMYNQVYDALKSVNAAVRVGGPYVTIDNRPDNQGDSDFGNPSLSGPYGSIDPRVLDVITYWLAHKHGADFIGVDGITYVNGDHFAPGQAFADATNWIHTQTTLPVWWAEWYATPWGSQTEYSDAEQNAVMTDALVQMMLSGVSVSLRWQPEASGSRDNESLWTSTRSPGGGQPYPFFSSAKLLHDYFPPGTQLVRSSASSPQVEVLASDKHVLAINKGASPVAVSCAGRFETLAPYAVVLLV